MTSEILEAGSNCAGPVRVSAPRRRPGGAQASRALADRDGLGDQCHEPGGVEVDVGQRGEQIEKRRARRTAGRGAELTQLLRVLADAEVDVNEHVLQRGGGGVLAAVAFADEQPKDSRFGRSGCGVRSVCSHW